MNFIRRREYLLWTQLPPIDLPWHFIPRIFGNIVAACGTHRELCLVEMPSALRVSVLPPCSANQEHSELIETGARVHVYDSANDLGFKLGLIPSHYAYDAEQDLLVIVTIDSGE